MKDLDIRNMISNIIFRLTPEILKKKPISFEVFLYDGEEELTSEWFDMEMGNLTHIKDDLYMMEMRRLCDAPTIRLVVKRSIMNQEGWFKMDINTIPVMERRVD